MRKPWIGIVPLVDVERASYWVLPGYLKGIEEAGGLPVMMPLSNDPQIIKQLAAGLDGFLFTGGPDLSAHLYGETNNAFVIDPCLERDHMEQALFQEVYQGDKAILGICRGMQLINVMLGGNLYQDIPTQCPSLCEHHQKAPYDQPSHNIIIVQDTPLYQVLKQTEIDVNSCHHQAIKQLASECRIMANASDGLIEAIDCPSHHFVWGVQWHPEFSHIVDENSRKIFKAFVNAAKLSYS